MFCLRLCLGKLLLNIYQLEKWNFNNTCISTWLFFSVFIFFSIFWYSWSTYANSTISSFETGFTYSLSKWCISFLSFFCGTAKQAVRVFLTCAFLGPTDRLSVELMESLQQPKTFYSDWDGRSEVNTFWLWCLKFRNTSHAQLRKAYHFDAWHVRIWQIETFGLVETKSV